MSSEAWTIHMIKGLTQKWNIFKAEVLRRAVRQLNEKADAEDYALSPTKRTHCLQETRGQVAEDAESIRERLAANLEARRAWRA
jgi:hypothetical protein